MTAHGEIPMSLDSRIYRCACNDRIQVNDHTRGYLSGRRDPPDGRCVVVCCWSGLRTAHWASVASNLTPISPADQSRGRVSF